MAFRDLQKKINDLLLSVLNIDLNTLAQQDLRKNIESLCKESQQFTKNINWHQNEVDTARAFLKVLNDAQSNELFAEKREHQKENPVLIYLKQAKEAVSSFIQEKDQALIDSSRDLGFKKPKLNIKLTNLKRDQKEEDDDNEREKPH